MSLCIAGTGYGGLVTGTCYAEMRSDVVWVDIVRFTVEELSF